MGDIEQTEQQNSDGRKLNLNLFPQRESKDMSVHIAKSWTTFSLLMGKSMLVDDGIFPFLQQFTRAFRDFPSQAGEFALKDTRNTSTNIFVQSEKAVLAIENSYESNDIPMGIYKPIKTSKKSTKKLDLLSKVIKEIVVYRVGTDDTHSKTSFGIKPKHMVDSKISSSYTKTLKLKFGQGSTEYLSSSLIASKEKQRPKNRPIEDYENLSYWAKFPLMLDEMSTSPFAVEANKTTTKTTDNKLFLYVSAVINKDISAHSVTTENGFFVFSFSTGRLLYLFRIVFNSVLDTVPNDDDNDDENSDKEGEEEEQKTNDKKVPSPPPPPPNTPPPPLPANVKSSGKKDGVSDTFEKSELDAINEDIKYYFTNYVQEPIFVPSMLEIPLVFEEYSTMNLKDKVNFFRYPVFKILSSKSTSLFDDTLLCNEEFAGFRRETSKKLSDAFSSMVDALDNKRESPLFSNLTEWPIDTTTVIFLVNFYLKCLLSCQELYLSILIDSRSVSENQLTNNSSNLNNMLEELQTVPTYFKNIDNVLDYSQKRERLYSNSADYETEKVSNFLCITLRGLVRIENMITSVTKSSSIYGNNEEEEGNVYLRENAIESAKNLAGEFVSLYLKPFAVSVKNRDKMTRAKFEVIQFYHFQNLMLAFLCFIDELVSVFAIYRPVNASVAEYGNNGNFKRVAQHYTVLSKKITYFISEHIFKRYNEYKDLYIKSPILLYPTSYESKSEEEDQNKKLFSKITDLLLEYL